MKPPDMRPTQGPDVRAVRMLAGAEFGAASIFRRKGVHVVRVVVNGGVADVGVLGDGREGGAEEGG